MSLYYEFNLPYFHGIPISVKELFDLKGKLVTVGFTMLTEEAEEDAACLKPILDQGAIPLVRGNVP